MRRDLGNNTYLFTNGPGIPTNVVISSHGGVMATTDMFTTPISLGFLGNLGESVALRLDNAIANFDFTGNTDIEVEPAGTRVRNYVLTKFQGRHTVHRKKVPHLVGRLFRTNDYEEDYTTILNTVGQYQDVGVVTIRNRKGRNNVRVTLADVITALDGLGVQRVLCLFCRVHTEAEAIDLLPGGLFQELESRF